MTEPQTREAVRLSPIDVDEQDVITFDFPELMAGESITSCDITVDVRAGEDPSPSAIKVGGYQVNGGLVMQLVKPGTQDVTYGLRALAHTNQNRRLLCVLELPTVYL